MGKGGDKLEKIWDELGMVNNGWEQFGMRGKGWGKVGIRKDWGRLEMWLKKVRMCQEC